MSARALFGISVVSSFCAWSITTFLYFWPELQATPVKMGLMLLMAPHMFRFIGLSFLVPGVVSKPLPLEFARPAAYGDLIAALLAMVATVATAADLPFGIAAVWIFNLWGAADLLNAMYQGVSKLLTTGPLGLGAAFYIPTVIVPALLISHALIFRLLLSPVH
jgi:hypothetical protein